MYRRIIMKYTSTEQNLIVLDSFRELTYKNKYLLTQGFKTPPQFNKFEEEVIKTLDVGVYNKLRELFESNDYRAKVLTDLDKKGIECITFVSQGYPESLRFLETPPMLLYCMGNSALLQERAIGIVGSRRSFQYIIERTKEIASKLTQKFVVVSGLADGADSAALAGGLSSGRVISVVPHGFNYCYPSTSKKIMDEVKIGGLLVSEYPPNTMPRSYLFHLRNRIIAGLCEGVLVVSAAKKSGALITAGYAMDFGKEVFAFPYSVNISGGEGCNNLIKRGANLVDCAEDIAKIFNLHLNDEDKIPLTDNEESVMVVLRKYEDIHVFNLAEEVKMPQYALVGILTSLEIKGKVVKLPGNKYSAV